MRVRLVLNPDRIPNPAAAGELMREGRGAVDVRWHPIDRGLLLTKLVIVRHGADLWMNLGSANFTRRNLDDLNLSAGIEARMPARTLPARAVIDYFDKAWSGARAYSEFADESGAAHAWYRIAEAAGLSGF